VSSLLIAGNAVAGCPTPGHGKEELDCGEATMGDGKEEAGRRSGICSIGAWPRQRKFVALASLSAELHIPAQVVAKPWQC